MFKFSSKSSYFVHRMFKFSGKGSYSVQSMLTFVHWLFKSNKLKCAPLSIWSKLVQIMFKLCSKFKLCSNYVQSSIFVQTMFKAHICSNSEDELGDVETWPGRPRVADIGLPAAARPLPAYVISAVSAATGGLHHVHGKSSLYHLLILFVRQIHMCCKCLPFSCD